jgi:peptidyl-prolyl cis-trans isomerase B (cyclophilin B)
MHRFRPVVLAALALSVVAQAAAGQVKKAAPASAPQKAAPLFSTTLSSQELSGKQAVLDTTAGRIVIDLLADRAPNHVGYFIKLAKEGAYDGTTFHRLVKHGIIQGGDPLSKDKTLTARYGTGGLGLLKAEFSERPMTRGSVAAVLRPNQPDSGGTQFFICLGDQPSLTGKYTIFGEVAEGMDVADKIGQTPVDGQKATVRVEIQKVTLR